MWISARALIAIECTLFTDILGTPSSITFFHLHSGHPACRALKEAAGAEWEDLPTHEPCPCPFCCCFLNLTNVLRVNELFSSCPSIFEKEQLQSLMSPGRSKQTRILLSACQAPLQSFLNAGSFGIWLLSAQPPRKHYLRCYFKNKLF